MAEKRTFLNAYDYAILAVLVFLSYLVFGFVYISSVANSLVAAGYNCIINPYQNSSYLMAIMPISMPMLQYALMPWLNPRPALIQLYTKYASRFCLP